MILITGGAGYVGCHVNKKLSNLQYDTLILDNLVYGHKSFVKWGKFIHGNFGDYHVLADIFSQYKIEAVMHLSAFAYVGESVTDPAKYYVNNLENTIHLLNMMIRFNIRNFIFSSTCSIYGIPNSSPIREDHNQCPINPYGKSKFMIEQILIDYQHAYGLKFISLRYFNAAGADPDGEIGENHCPETHLIPSVINTALGLNEFVNIFGSDYPTPDGSCIRDYIHVNDIADAHVKALQYLESEGKSDVFNLGNEKGISVFEIIECVKKISNRPIQIKMSERRAGDPPMLIASLQKVKKVLNWSPVFTDIQDIVSSAWNWHDK